MPACLLRLPIRHSLTLTLFGGFQVCDAGKYRAAGGVAGATCDDCEAGEYAGAGAASCEACEAGKYSAAIAGSCTPCTTNADSPEKSTADTACLCNAGYYGGGAAECAVFFPFDCRSSLESLPGASHMCMRVYVYMHACLCIHMHLATSTYMHVVP